MGFPRRTANGWSILRLRNGRRWMQRTMVCRDTGDDGHRRYARPEDHQNGLSKQVLGEELSVRSASEFLTAFVSRKTLLNSTAAAACRSRRPHSSTCCSECNGSRLVYTASFSSQNLRNDPVSNARTRLERSLFERISAFKGSRRLRYESILARR